MSLKPIASFKASRNALRDIDLTWRQMTMGKNGMLHQMTATGWTQAHINSLAHFFAGLDLNTYRNRANGEQILLTYQARVRREWHDALKRDQAFDISILNETLLRSIADEIWDNIRTEGIKLVSQSNLTIVTTLTSPSYPPLLYYILRDTMYYILRQCTHATCYIQCATRYTHATCYMLHATPLHATCHHPARRINISIFEW
jgi:hypothetical protein